MEMIERFKEYTAALEEATRKGSTSMLISRLKTPAALSAWRLVKMRCPVKPA